MNGLAISSNDMRHKGADMLQQKCLYQMGFAKHDNPTDVDTVGVQSVHLHAQLSWAMVTFNWTMVLVPVYKHRRELID